MKNASFHYGSASSALILISLHLKCLVFKFPFTTYFAFPTLNSVWAQMRTLLKRTAEGEDGEKSGLIIYHRLWKEKGNKLPTDLLSLETIEAEKQTTLAMALCTVPICVDHSLLDRLQLICWEKSMGEARSSSIRLSAHRWEGRPQIGTGLWLCFIIATWLALDTSIPLPRLMELQNRCGKRVRHSLCKTWNLKFNIVTLLPGATLTGRSSLVKFMRTHFSLVMLPLSHPCDVWYIKCVADTMFCGLCRQINWILTTGSLEEANLSEVCGSRWREVNPALLASPASSASRSAALETFGDHER